METQLEKALRASRMCGLNSYTRNGVRYSIDGDNILAEWIGDTDISDIEILEGATWIPSELNGFSFAHRCIKTLKLPSTLKHIPYGAFSYNEELCQVSFSEGTETINARAFAGTAIETIKFPSTLISIGFSAFGNCPRLKQIEFTNGLTDIGSRAFSETPIESITVPATVKRIEFEAFMLCKTLKEVQLNIGLEALESGVFQGTALTSVKIPYTVKGDYTRAFDSEVKLIKGRKPRF